MCYAYHLSIRSIHQSECGWHRCRQRKIICGLSGVSGAVYSTFTVELRRLASDLRSLGVRTVAMEATGVYWLPVHEALEAAGLQVCVVNGAHVKNVPGRKTDMADCQWLAHLHALGLLRPAFVPPQHIRQIRDYHRLRQDHVRACGQAIQHMQKALDRMNVKIHEALSSIAGVSGLRLIEAILGGQRDPEKLLELCDVQVIARKEQAMLKALEGNYRPEHLFALGQAYEAWQFFQKQILACDQQIAALLEQCAPQGPLPPPPTIGRKKRAKKITRNAPQVAQLHELLVRWHGGQDLTQLPCFTDYTLMQLLAEVGTDMSRWPSAKHFTAWLGLAPGSHQSGKSRRSHRQFIGPAGRIFCMIAQSVARSRYLALGGFYRRLSGRYGGKLANVAVARKLAVLFYNGLRYGMRYVEQGLEQYEAKYKAQSLKRLQKAASVFGMQLVLENRTA